MPPRPKGSLLLSLLPSLPPHGEGEGDGDEDGDRDGTPPCSTGSIFIVRWSFLLCFPGDGESRLFPEPESVLRAEENRGEHSRAEQSRALQIVAVRLQYEYRRSLGNLVVFDLSFGYDRCTDTTVAK
jgi:hypothetical protein